MKSYASTIKNTVTVTTMDSKYIMSDKELEDIGMSRELWDKLVEQENRYIIAWSHTIDPKDL